ncbi:bacteriocin [Acuticoccus yangtzensis]|uniref:bacteriocin n=1 Tax=Acuticoccus yangtzensis TaxID=1443441 RepID=UPI000949974A|nr:bacteriocin [Acuticoccus yangtzensis]ORE95878.1 hypothetical protein ATO13_03430 [Stappia sp. 22II-S9-Z10]
MKKYLIIAAVAAGLAGCNSNDPGDRALVGGALGAATGATVAAATGANAGGTLVGAGVGAVGGAALGAATAPRCVNQYGTRVPC